MRVAGWERGGDRSSPALHLPALLRERTMAAEGAPEICPHCRRGFPGLLEVLTHPCPVVLARSRERTEARRRQRYAPKPFRRKPDAQRE